MQVYSNWIKFSVFFKYQELIFESLFEDFAGYKYNIFVIEKCFKLI